MENNKYHILIVEDDKEIRDGVEIYLKNQGYQVWKAANGKEGLEIVAQEEIHLAILDIMMPVMDGVTMLMKLREQNHEFPVIMLSAKSEEVDKIMGLNMGADDYITKPFSMPLVVRRIEAVLRRTEQGTPADASAIRYKDLVLDTESFLVFVAGENISLTTREFEILKLLLENQGRVFTRENILDTVWGYEYFGDKKIVNTHIKNIRRKLGVDYIETIRGMGYKIEKENQ